MSRTKPLLTLAAWTARVLPAALKQRLYHIPFLARLLRNSLNRAAPVGLSEVTIAAGELEGIRMSLDLQREKDYWLGTYESNLQTAIVDLIHPGAIVYDVGANIGYISLMLARRVGERGRVFAFEALPSNIARLKTNLSLSGMDDRVVVISAAVVEKNRPVRFLVGPSGGMGKAEGSAGRKEFAYTESVDTVGIGLDDFVFLSGNPAPEAVKMDIEGGEVLALPGMRRLLRETHPLVLLELHGQEAADTAWKEFTAAGYVLREMRKGYPVITSAKDLNWKAYLVASYED